MPHTRSYVSAGGLVRVSCSQPMIVMVMSDKNLRSYQDGKETNYYGGFFSYFPIQIEIPESGFWNIILEKRVFTTRKLTYSINVID